jgi:hypothetical protein
MRSKKPLSEHLGNQEGCSNWRGLGRPEARGIIDYSEPGDTKLSRSKNCAQLSAHDRGGISLEGFAWEALTPVWSFIDEQWASFPRRG